MSLEIDLLQINFLSILRSIVYLFALFLVLFELFLFLETFINRIQLLPLIEIYHRKYFIRNF